MKQSITRRAFQLEGWALFAWAMGLTSVAVLLIATTVDLSTGPGTVSMIRTSVRFSAPWVLVAFVASSSRHRCERSSDATDATDATDANPKH